MGSKWRKVKMALGLNMCVFVPTNNVADNDRDDDSSPPSGLRSAAVVSPPIPENLPAAPPTPGSNKMRLSKSLSRTSSKKTCAICLASVRRGKEAIFTAECSHTFHFQCIASNVMHGNRNCPVCRAKWKEIPSQGQSLDPPMGRSRVNPIDLPNNDRMSFTHHFPPHRSNSSRNVSPLDQTPEPAVYNDDEPLNLETASSERRILIKSSDDRDDQRKVIINSYTEVSAVPRSSAVDSFTVLLHLKAPCSNSWHNLSMNDANLPQISQLPRAPVDLVTVLDISGSMAGTKLALLKRAMGFLIQNLGPSDRLAVTAFSSSARRLFPLRRMSETGRYQALQAVNSLFASGGTNIAEGLRKGARIMEDRREKNSVTGIILLSDGQDTYSINNSGGNQNQPNYVSLLPLSIRPRPEENSGFKIPVHTFGFGTDHDASSLHSISEISGGTFSFIETIGAIQDAFAQCIGGLLSVVVKNLKLKIECIHPTIHLGSIKAGSYPNHVSSNHRIGSIDVGDLYADEERNFLVSMNIPTESSSNRTSLVKVRCLYSDPFSEETVNLEDQEVRIERTEVAGQETISIEVDRQWNRIRAAEAMAGARTAAERGDLTGAISTLENCQKMLSETVSAKSHDGLCIALDTELKEMQERMVNRRVYEESGRAFILSGLSSHSWQRATARGSDSTDGLSHVQAYQTPSMVEMVSRSQATLMSGSSTQRRLRPTWSFASQPNPRQ